MHIMINIVKESIMQNLYLFNVFMSLERRREH